MEISAGQLLGKWKLVSFRMYCLGWSWNWGYQASGILEYKADGQMNVEISCSSRQRLNIAGIFFGNRLVYGGTYHLQGRQVYHEIVYCSKKSWIGRQLIREIIKMEGGRMSLGGGGRSMKYILEWER